MKRTLVAAFIVSILLMMPASGAGIVSQGQRELVLDGAIFTESPQGTSADLGIKAGRFVIDGLLTGFEIRGAHNDVRTIGRVGLYSDYNLDLGYYTVPFLGVAIGYNYTDLKEGDSGDFTIFEAYLGTKHFLSDYVAISVRALYEKATSDIFSKKSGDSTDNRFGVRLGMAYYF
jgi:hypothetical protein